MNEELKQPEAGEPVAPEVSPEVLAQRKKDVAAGVTHIFNEQLVRVMGGDQTKIARLNVEAGGEGSEPSGLTLEKQREVAGILLERVKQENNPQKVDARLQMIRQREEAIRAIRSVEEILTKRQHEGKGEILSKVLRVGDMALRGDQTKSYEVMREQWLKQLKDLDTAILADFEEPLRQVAEKEITDRLHGYIDGTYQSETARTEEQAGLQKMRQAGVTPEAVTREARLNRIHDARRFLEDVSKYQQGNIWVLDEEHKKGFVKWLNERANEITKVAAAEQEGKMAVKKKVQEIVAQKGQEEKPVQEHLGVVIGKGVVRGVTKGMEGVRERFKKGKKEEEAPAGGVLPKEALVRRVGGPKPERVAAMREPRAPERESGLQTAGNRALFERLPEPVQKMLRPLFTHAKGAVAHLRIMYNEKFEGQNSYKRESYQNQVNQAIAEKDRLVARMKKGGLSGREFNVISGQIVTLEETTIPNLEGKIKKHGGKTEKYARRRQEIARSVAENIQKILAPHEARMEGLIEKKSGIEDRISEFQEKMNGRASMLLKLRRELAQAERAKRKDRDRDEINRLRNAVKNASKGLSEGDRLISGSSAELSKVDAKIVALSEKTKPWYKKLDAFQEVVKRGAGERPPSEEDETGQSAVAHA